MTAPMPYKQVLALKAEGQDVCTVPSCRYRGTDHPGLCKEINGEVEFDGRGRNQ